MNYRIITYGCQMNKSDSEKIAAVLESIGYKTVSKIAEADLIVVNMCSVRQSAVDRVFGQVKNLEKLRTKNQKLKTVLTGCILKKDLKKFKEKFDLILDIKDLAEWPKLLKNQKSDISFFHDREKMRQKLSRDYFKFHPKYQSSFSAFVPIMTGCNNFCSYCVVPYVRGPEVSRPAKEIVCQVENLIKRGYKEIWLLGQNVNSYSPIPFWQLLKKINNIPGNFWIRFTSSHPKPPTNNIDGRKDFSWDELIDTMADCQKVTEYLNLPVQSGDDEILKKMNRPYTIAYYKNLVKKIRKRIPEICLSTDVIVGFPDETEKQFENTLALFKEIKFDMAYIAQYSPREGTAAAKLKDNVSKKEKERRWKILTEVLKKTALEKNRKYIGKEVQVLPEAEKKGFLIGKSRAYKTIKFEGPKDLIGQFVKVKITGALPWGLEGKLT